MQVLSHGAPSAQKLSGADAADLTRRVNDRLACRRDRQPEALCGLRGAADLRSEGGGRRTRARVTKLGFKGAMIHGLANGVLLDDKRFWPIFERAAGARRADLSASVACRCRR